VQFCDPHPEYSNEYLVYFYFFGITKKQLSAIRTFISRNSNYRQLENEDKDIFRYNPDNLFMSREEKRIKNVVIIDTDEGGLDALVKQLNTEMDQLRIVGETSYFAFYQKYLGNSSDELAPSDMSQVSAASEADMGLNPLEFHIDQANFDIVTAPELPDPELEMLGHSLAQMMDTNDSWMKLLFPTDTEKKPVEEAITAARLGRPVEKLFYAKNYMEENKALLISFKRTKGEDTVKVSISSTTNENVRMKLLREAPLDGIDAIIIDNAIVPNNAIGWAENLHETVKSKNLLAKGKDLKILVSVSAEDNIDPRRFKSPYIPGVFYRPLDMRSFMATLSLHIHNKYTVYNYDNLGWLDTRIGIQLAKDTQLKEISEFGATIHTPKPIAPGTFLFLRGEIFNKAPRKNLCARFYTSEKDEEGGFNNYLMYFGINEDFMVYARNWFREVYAKSKQENEGG